MRNRTLALSLALLLGAACERPTPGTGTDASADAIRAAESRSATAEETSASPLFRAALVGNQRPVVRSDAGTLRGVAAGGLPWAIERGEARLDRDGTLRVRVRGLIIDPAESAPVAGTNPVAQFRAIVSCQTVENGALTVANVSTDLVAASAEGDAEIREQLQLPDPCYAPVVFVTSPTNAWFAVTGF